GVHQPLHVHQPQREPACRVPVPHPVEVLAAGPGEDGDGGVAAVGPVVAGAAEPAVDQCVLGSRPGQGPRVLQLADVAGTHGAGRYHFEDRDVGVGDPHALAVGAAHDQLRFELDHVPDHVGVQVRGLARGEVTTHGHAFAHRHATGRVPPGPAGQVPIPVTHGGQGR